MEKDYFSNFIQELSFKEQIYERIKRLIMLNKLKPGERLIEINLSKSMHLSRGPLREALNRLDVEGYVDIVPNRGTFVHKVCQREVIDTFDFFNILYYNLIVSVLDKISATEIDQFIEDLKKISPDKIININSMNNSNLMDKKIDIDHRFYSFLIDRIQNKVFGKYMNILHGKIHWYRSISKVKRPVENSFNNRLEIYLSLKKKDIKLINQSVMKNSEDSKSFSIVG